MKQVRSRKVCKIEFKKSPNPSKLIKRNAKTVNFKANIAEFQAKILTKYG